VSTTSTDPAGFDLSRLLLAEAVARINRDGLTGTLAAFSGNIQRYFLFVNGELRVARSNAESEKLGSWLVQRNLITDEQKEQLLHTLTTQELPSLGHLVVHRKLLDQATLDQELQGIAQEIILRAAQCLDLEIGYYEGHDGPLPWDTLPDLSTPQIVLTMARLYPDEQRKRQLLEPVTQKVVATGKLDDFLVDFELLPGEAFLLSRLSQGQTKQSLLTAAGLPEADAATALFALTIAGLIRPAEGEQPRVRQPRVAAPSPTSQPRGTVFSPAAQQERDKLTRLASEVATLDHYQVLELTPKARTHEIAHAFRRLSRLFHPNRVNVPHLADLGKELERVHQRLENAHEVLSSVTLRNRYDTIRMGVLRDENGEVQEDPERQDRQNKARQELITANIRRADELVQIGDTFRAVELLEAAAKIEPRSQTFVKLGRLLSQRSTTTKRALDALRRATDLDPGCQDAWIELSLIWKKRGQVERQRKALERALAIDPNNERVCQLYRESFKEAGLTLALQRLEYSGMRVEDD